MFCHRSCVQLDKSVQNTLHKCMKKKFILAHLNPVTLTFDPKINLVPMILRTDVWTKFKEGRSRRSDRPTDMFKAICPLFFEGGGGGITITVLN